jgi:hypothetical protein
MGIFVLPSVAGCLYTPQASSCEDGSVFFEGGCVTGEWLVVHIDFVSYNKFEVNEGDLVRLEFDPSSFGHYVPDSFHLEEFGISEQLTEKEIVRVDFLADKVGDFLYSSSGLCRVAIPGGSEVVVDCAIYCGETENGRSGLFSVVPVNLSNPPVSIGSL